MIALALSIFTSSVLLIIFKYFGKYKVNNFQAIAVNYMVAAGLGFALSPVNYPINQLLEQKWTLSAIVIGAVFIGMFYIMAISSQKVGVAISSVANKMSLVIPVIAGVILYNESLKGLKLVGVLLAVVAVVLVTFPKGKSDIDRKYLFLPLIIFVGSGFLDTFFKYVQTHQLGENEIGIFSSSLFLVSALVGLIVMIIRRIINGSTLEAKSIVAGFALGIPNYFSIHFLLNALNLPNLESTVVFPINNTGIVLLSTLFAIILFSEKLSKLNWAGIVLAVTSIALIAAA
ncbi:MAG: EamA/RhaT family transporter [Flavobacteriales bacterium]|nr:EamA/RhaT family transporter [Flavobacteriales bacterium]